MISRRGEGEKRHLEYVLFFIVILFCGYISGRVAEEDGKIWGGWEGVRR